MECLLTGTSVQVRAKVSHPSANGTSSTDRHSTFTQHRGEVGTSEYYNAQSYFLKCPISGSHGAFWSYGYSADS